VPEAGNQDKCGYGEEHRAMLADETR